MSYNKESRILNLLKSSGWLWGGETVNKDTVAAKRYAAGGVLFIYAGLELITGRWCESEVKIKVYHGCVL